MSDTQNGDDYDTIQTYTWQNMANQTSWNVGYGHPVAYGGWFHAPYWSTNTMYCESCYQNTAHYFKVPGILDGHAITAVRAKILSPGVLLSAEFPPFAAGTGTHAYLNTEWPGSLRIRASSTLLNPIGVLQSDFTQISGATLTNATNSVVGVTWYDFWNWQAWWAARTPPVTYQGWNNIPIFDNSASSYYSVDLNANAVSTFNSNRGAWLHLGWTQDQFQRYYSGMIECAFVSGIVVQIYVV